ncbi:MAG: acetyl-CoA carboxylase biotin carboxyl carrier protein [Sphingomonadales bacterium]|nr:MAG: acetyl-CoA carboxylase biotin carboxyl carrier protein [Sphingomonadales bacterium]
MASKSPSRALSVDTAQLRELAELLKETDLTEIEIADGERRIRLARQMTVVATAPVAAAAPAAAPAALPEAPAPEATPDIGSHPGLVKSPMVGTVYVSNEPGKPAFVSVGSTVKEGDTLLIIEAMKVMNPIAAPRGGTVTRILVANEQPVEFGEPLLVIE